MSIKLLNKDVINQISAGEVVEKPASVIKELVENSIDAKASEITVEIKNGGIDYMSVTDNGCGIAKDEIILAFTPHATSKISNISDLETLLTMGFRGEALATISAVSKTSMVTKTTTQDTGIKVELEAGEIVAEQEVACITGTKIEVKNLFFNTPARLKFLRKPKSEENDITNYMQKLILSHCDISFKYIVDGKIIYNTIAGSLFDRVYAIYGIELAENMLKVDYKLDNYRVHGFISKPEYAKSNRTYQTLFVNSRFCNNMVVSSAISGVYDDFLMKGKFPAFILFLELPQIDVDVNVHPNKLEVKFVDTRKIYKVFSDAIFNTLSNFNQIKIISTNIKENTQNELDNSQNVSLNTTLSEGISFDNSNNNDENNIFDDFNKSTNKGSYKFNLTENILPTIDLSENKNALIEEVADTNRENCGDVFECNKPSQQEICNDILCLDYKIVGKVFNTYLILEYKNSMFLVDQHAAHERINYDKLLSEINNNLIHKQNLLVPYIFKVSQQENTFLSENIEYFNSCGIEIDEFGFNTYKISAIPVILMSINVKDFIDEILKNLSALAKSPKDILKEKLMQIACKSSVKAGDNLSDNEITHLLNKLTENKHVLLCPHGRPIIIEITKNEVEKMFKRIV